jgi:hypothetical protein
VSLTEIAKKFLEEKKQSAKPSTSVVTNVEQVTDYNISLQDALKLLKFPDDMLSQLSKSLRLVKNCGKKTEHSLDSVLQSLKQVMPDRNFGVISLRKMCSEYANSYENNQWFEEAVIKDVNQEARDDIWNAYVTEIGKRGCPRKVWKNKNSHTEKCLLHTGSDLTVK